MFFFFTLFENDIHTSQRDLYICYDFGSSQPNFDSFCVNDGTLKNCDFLPSNWCRGSSPSSERETGKKLSVKNTELGIARDRYSGQGQG